MQRTNKKHNQIKKIDKKRDFWIIFKVRRHNYFFSKIKRPGKKLSRESIITCEGINSVYKLVTPPSPQKKKKNMVRERPIKNINFSPPTE